MNGAAGGVTLADGEETVRLTTARLIEGAKVLRRRDPRLGAWIERAASPAIALSGALSVDRLPTTSLHRGSYDPRAIHRVVRGWQADTSRPSSPTDRSTPTLWLV
ncbi:MAG: hypothetical protein MK538_00955 [Planctomycetes bacterium]|nr:hypothetical protein [Planctomycetota bacterium]